MTFAELTDHQNRLVADPGFDPAFDQLIDSTDVTSFTVSAREAEILASRRIFSSHSIRAFAAVKQDVFGIARLMEVHHRMRAGSERVGIFRSRDAAEEWLLKTRQERLRAPQT